MNNSSSSLLYDYCVSGIDFSLPGNGGSECIDHITAFRRSLETILGLILGTIAFAFGYKSHKRSPLEAKKEYVYSGFRMFLAAASCFVMGLEVCYKLATRQAIFVVNPCHMLLFVQTYLLVAPPSSVIATSVYRIHLCLLHGPFMAVVFPVTNTLFLPLEVFTYWVEHVLLLINPLYMLIGSVYSVERSMNDLSWVLMSYGLWGWYHFVPLQGLALLTEANLNSMLCPAITDPFYGPNYRSHAMWHQFLMTLVTGKLCFLIGNNFTSLDKKEN